MEKELLKKKVVSRRRSSKRSGMQQLEQGKLLQYG